MNFASVLASRIATRSPSIQSIDSRDGHASTASSQDSCPSTSSESSSLSTSLDSSSFVSEPRSFDPTVVRPNEHLAVLLPRRLWKPDAQATRCDRFLCRKPFSIWERRHHCRKCGGVFCHECSQRAIPLLDTSHLDFHHPPRDTPISAFDSPTSPVLLSRVCQDCFDQIHGVRTSRSPVGISTPIALANETRQDSDSISVSSSPSSSSISTPPDSVSPLKLRPALRRAHTSSPRLPSSPLRSPVHSSQSLQALAPSVHVLDSELMSPITHSSDADLGELEAYPLCRASALCKALGGGRWEPKQRINLMGTRLPGMKAVYEIEMEREEEERRRWKSNPIIRDGDIQLRVPRELEPRSPAGPIQLATF